MSDIEPLPIDPDADAEARADIVGDIVPDENEQSIIQARRAWVESRTAVRAAALAVERAKATLAQREAEKDAAKAEFTKLAGVDV